ncbi:sigma-70 family RNA polymerase sigma factor [Bordetella sp. BOR01]|uniref:sigma-70 family RNA polymerase sigma factor n=1 Tax=Bordetella sp. BOR01 TaxID=2854779 RepID=UPI001C4794AE|nr:sigma-70 family RNA polymerase sigma factor [Bordetella sp. BOR01]MBV7483076.1 sigma-70 family RNA polymerase sigma factor [Bordetella sp. BOR01]
MSTSLPAPQDAVHGLYRDHHGWLDGWLRRKLGNACDAADLVQDTFVRVLRHRAELAMVREPRAYLTTIAKRLLLNHYRRRSLEQAYLEALAALPEPRAPSPEQRLLILEALHEIDAVLHALPQRVREAFLLAQLERMPYEDIAQRLNVSVRTVQRYIVQGYEQCILATS